MTGGEGGTIHIAPCFCELHQALREALERNRELGGEVHMLRLGNINLQAHARELEVELATERKAAEYGRMRLGPNLRKMVDDQQARAEKAEAELASWRPTVDALKARAEKAEAAAHTEATTAQIHFEARQRLEARVADLERQLQTREWESDRYRSALRSVGDETPSQGVHEREAD